MKDKHDTEKCGLGFFEALGLLFIGLRICNVIDWPWVWVLSPIWGAAAFYLLVTIIILLYEKWKDKID